MVIRPLTFMMSNELSDESGMVYMNKYIDNSSNNDTRE